MEQCYPDIDVDQSDLDVSASSSSLPFEFVEYNKSQMSPSHVAMFYPQLGYDLHPLLMNQRKRNDSLDKLDASPLLTTDDFQVAPHHLVINSTKITKTRPKSKCSRKKEDLREATTSQTSPTDVPDVQEKNRKIFFCRDCGKSFKFQTSLLRHNNKVHNCKYQCPTCHRVFSRQAYLDVHTSKPGSSCFLNCYPNVRTSVTKQPKI